MKLMVLMVPLILVSGFVVIFGLRSTTTSSWDFIARQPAWLWWGHGNSSLNGASSVAVHAKESDESPPLINGLSPPPQAVEALPFEEPVSPLTHVLLITYLLCFFCGRLYILINDSSIKKKKNRLRS